MVRRFLARERHQPIRCHPFLRHHACQAEPAAKPGCLCNPWTIALVKLNSKYSPTRVDSLLRTAVRSARSAQSQRLRLNNDSMHYEHVGHVSRNASLVTPRENDSASRGYITCTIYHITCSPDNDRNNILCPYLSQNPQNIRNRRK